MHRTFYFLASLLVLMICLAACSSNRLPLTSTISVEITQAGCRPMDWRLPAGQAVSLKLTNKALQDYTWIFMGRPVTPPFNASDTANVFFARQVGAGASVSLQFKTPAAAGVYQVICAPYDHSGEEQAGRITVVQP
jgi:hypothetical protein